MKTKEIESANQKLEQEVRKISTAMRDMVAGPIRRDTIVKLISWRSGVGSRIVEDVLYATETLDKGILKKP